MTPSSNWSGTVDYHHREVLRPADVDEVRRLVAGAGSLRVLGTGHTFTDLPDGDVGMSLAAFTDVEVTPDGRSAWVGGAATYSELAVALRPHDLAVANLASLPHISVAGAVATGTHGSGAKERNLATSVSALELVTATGDLLTIERGEPDFDGAVVSLGTLGVVTRLRLDVVPAVPYRQVVLDGLTWDDLLARPTDLLELGRSVSVFTQWGRTPGEVWVKARDDDAPAPRWPGLVPATDDRHPIPGVDPVNTTAQHDVPGWWADRIPHFRMGFTPSHGDEVQSEYHVPRRHADVAIEAMRTIGSRIRPALQTCEIRTVAADTLWLSPQHGQDTCAFHFTWVGDVAAADAAAAVVEEALAPFDPLPHWGKVFHAPPADRFARIEDFRALRARLDPDEVFVNDWVRRVLLPA